MKLNDYLRGIAGFVVLISAILTYYVSPLWIILTVFVGLNLIQSAFTKWCPMISLLRKLNVKE